MVMITPINFEFYLELDANPTDAQRIADHYRSLVWSRSGKPTKTVNCSRPGMPRFEGHNETMSVYVMKCNPFDDGYTVLASFVNKSDAMLFRLTFGGTIPGRFQTARF